MRIYTIGVGIHGQSMIPIQDPTFGRRLVPIQEDLDEPSLKDIAHATGGRYFRATSTKEFDEIYREIDKLERSEIHGPKPQEYQDLYLPWLISAMLCLSAAVLLDATVLRKIP